MQISAPLPVSAPVSAMLAPSIAFSDDGEMDIKFPDARVFIFQ